VIAYTTIGYYYLVFLATTLTSLLNKKIEKKYLLAFLNIIFQTLFFYFLKFQFITMITSLVINWLAIKYLEQSPSWKKTGLSILVFLNVCFFIFVKYKTFHSFLPESNFKLLAFIGISFFTFRLTSLIVDMKRGLISKIDIVTYYNYLTFFPTFLSGPLDKYIDFKKEVDSNTNLKDINFVNALFRFVWGVFKKVIIADLIHSLAIDSMSNIGLSHLSLFKILVSLYFYTIELYFDFSGYSDMAIGLSLMMGIKIPENFNRPFLATNIPDFWNRWHISFMQWLREYVYYPFQHFLIKKLKIKNYFLTTVISTILIFILAGTWHGDQLQYLFYGIYHATAFTLYLIWRKFISNKERKNFRTKYIDTIAFKYFSIFLTFHYVVFGFLFFTGHQIIFEAICNFSNDNFHSSVR
jgi:membrane protein involved in D-alanine export